MSKLTTENWRAMLRHVCVHGLPVAQASAGAEFKGAANREVLAMQSQWPMRHPVVACPARRLGYRFMTAEAAWILSGDNRLSSIVPYSKHMENFADGPVLQGAYGPPFIDQAGYVLQALSADPFSRQAVVTIWRPRPATSRDTPCTVSLQWLIRSGNLHCVATMRSSDVMTGVPYDIFTFSMMSAWLAIELRRGISPNLQLGALILTAGSQHLYERDRDAARGSMERNDMLFEVSPLDLAEFERPDDLTAYLWSCARRERQSKKWLQEMYR